MTFEMVSKHNKVFLYFLKAKQNDLEKCIMTNLFREAPPFTEK